MESPIFAQPYSKADVAFKDKSKNLCTQVNEHASEIKSVVPVYHVQTPPSLALLSLYGHAP